MDASTSKKRKWLKILLIFAGIVIVVAVVTIVGAFWATSAPTEAARTFLQQLSSGQEEAVYSSTAGIFKESVSSEAFSAFLEQNPIVKNVKESSFTSRSIENGIATISGMITATDGSVSPILIQLIKEQDEWRVFNVDLNPPPPSDAGSDWGNDY